MAAFLERLTATHDAKFFIEEGLRLGNPLRIEPRGSVLNRGLKLEAVHPVIRTNRQLPSPPLPLPFLRKRLILTQPQLSPAGNPSS